MSKKFDADSVYVCFDTTTKNWRKAYYPDYKGNRKEARDKQSDIVDWQKFFEFIQTFKEEIKEVFPFYVIEQDGLEADDVIAYLTKNNLDKKKILITSDGDYVQLLRFKNTQLFDPMKQKMVTGINPVLELEKKILTGDKSDNVPSVKPRLGIKTAEKIISSGELDILLEEKTSTGEYGPFRKNYDRNKKLIDLSKTPQSLQNELQEVIDNYELSDGKMVFSYLKKNKLRDLLGDMNNIRQTIQKINIVRSQSIL